MVELRGIVPEAVERRLILNLCGWRWDGRGYACGTAYISEEVLDSLTESAWRALMAPWLSSGAN